MGARPGFLGGPEAGLRLRVVAKSSPQHPDHNIPPPHTSANRPLYDARSQQMGTFKNSQQRCVAAAPVTCN